MQNGLSGLVVLGSNGEFPFLSTAERELVLRTVKQTLDTSCQVYYFLFYFIFTRHQRSALLYLCSYSSLLSSLCSLSLSLSSLIELG